MNKVDYASLALRIGLGLYFFIFGLLQIFQPDQLMHNIYLLPDYGTTYLIFISIVGIIQMLAAAALVFGFKTPISTIILVLIYLISIIIVLPRILTPFTFPATGPAHFFYFTAIPVLTALIALLFLGAGSYSLDAKRG
jgi:uncharacterized membrane protein YphA (DoxX/SURF4 family)